MKNYNKSAIMKRANFLSLIMLKNSAFKLAWEEARKIKEIKLTFIKEANN